MNFMLCGNKPLGICLCGGRRGEGGGKVFNLESMSLSKGKPQLK